MIALADSDPPIRTCGRRACNKRLVRRPKETAKKFADRIYCSTVCSTSRWKNTPTKKGVG